MTMTIFEGGYLEAMHFTECSNQDDECFGADLSEDFRASASADCAAFQEAASALLEEAYDLGYSEDQAGIDFWLTRNDHGVGFWDRDILKTDAAAEGVSLGDALTKIAKGFGEMLPYVGDDGLIYA